MRRDERSALSWPRAGVAALVLAGLTAVAQGINLKAIAEYVSASGAMIENSYGRFISVRGLAPLMDAIGMAPSENLETGNLAGTFASKRPAQTRKPRAIRRLQSGPRGNRIGVRTVAKVRRKCRKRRRDMVNPARNGRLSHVPIYPRTTQKRGRKPDPVQRRKVSVRAASLCSCRARQPECCADLIERDTNRTALAFDEPNLDQRLHIPMDVLDVAL